MTRPPANSVHPTSRAKWRAWLETNHTRDEGVWLILDKKAAGRVRLSYEDAVLEAVCFGWIDGRGEGLDEVRTMLWLSPRKPGSGWSASNKARIERLLADGLMHPAGLAKIEAAKADGSWTRLDAVERLEVPADLAAAFAARAEAAKHFDAFPRSVRRAILEWIASAKRPETRAKRVLETAEKASRNERANQRRD